MEVADLAGKSCSSQDPKLIIFSGDHICEAWNHTDEHSMERPATTTPQSSSLVRCHFTTSASLSVYGALESSLWVLLLPTFLISRFLIANADIQVVLSLQHSSTYSRAPSNCRNHVSPSHIRRGEPPARRPHAHHLCPPCSIPRRDPYNL